MPIPLAWIALALCLCWSSHAVPAPVLLVQPHPTSTNITTTTAASTTTTTSITTTTTEDVKTSSLDGRSQSWPATMPSTLFMLKTLSMTTATELSVSPPPSSTTTSTTLPTRTTSSSMTSVTEQTVPPPPTTMTSSALPTALPTTTSSSSTTTEATTSRFDAESSAESFESGEATSASAIYYKTVTEPLSGDVPSFKYFEEPIPSSSSASSSGWTKSPPLWPWMLFVLNGNATVANRRQRDLGTYLRLNLAARLDADYNDVVINRILLTPMAILANISVEPSHLEFGGTGAAGLEALGQGNVTLLELSGHEFQVDRIIRFDEMVDQRTMMSGMEMSSMTATVSSEVTVYGAVGAVFLFLLVALLLGLSFSSPCKASDESKYLSNNVGGNNLGYDRDQMDNYSDGTAMTSVGEWKNTSTTSATPPVIYTEQLAKQMGTGVLTRGHFIPSRPSTPSTTTLAELHHHQHQHRCQQEDSSSSSFYRNTSQQSS